VNPRPRTSARVRLPGRQGEPSPRTCHGRRTQTVDTCALGTLIAPMKRYALSARQCQREEVRATPRRRRTHEGRRALGQKRSVSRIGRHQPVADPASPSRGVVALPRPSRRAAATTFGHGQQSRRSAHPNIPPARSTRVGSPNGSDTAPADRHRRTIAGGTVALIDRTGACSAGVRIHVPPTPEASRQSKQVRAICG
jgi:hypothetical protein